LGILWDLFFSSRFWTSDFHLSSLEHYTTAAVHKPFWTYILAEAMKKIKMYNLQRIPFMIRPVSEGSFEKMFSGGKVSIYRKRTRHTYTSTELEAVAHELGIKFSCEKFLRQGCFGTLTELHISESPDKLLGQQYCSSTSSIEENVNRGLLCTAFVPTADEEFMCECDHGHQAHFLDARKSN